MSRRRRRRKSHPKSRYRTRVPIKPDHFNGFGFVDNSLGVGTVNTGVFYRMQNGNKVDVGKVAQVMGTQVSLAGQKTWDFTNPGPPYRQGGAFRSHYYELPTREVKGFVRATNLGRSGTDTKNHTVYEGRFVHSGSWAGDSNTSAYTDVGFSNFPDLSSYHSLAWDLLKPQISKGNIGQFLAELKDFPRMLTTSANLLFNSWRSFGGGYSRTVMSPSSVADNFLNHEFGWKPFLADYLEILDTVLKTGEYLSRIRRENNQWVRKARVIEEEDKNTLILREYGANTFPSSEHIFFNQTFGKVMTIDGISCRGFSDTWMRETRRVWAVGSFKYYRPEFDALLNTGFAGEMIVVRRLRQLLTLHGARISPSLIWELTPWSWLVDYFSSFGKFLRHHEDFVVDGIISKYLYVMQKTERVLTKTCVNNFWSGAHTVHFQRLIRKKQRAVADSPYGFNVPWNTLSLRQVAILGAVGFSQTPTGFIMHGT